MAVTASRKGRTSLTNMVVHLPLGKYDMPNSEGSFKVKSKNSYLKKKKSRPFLKFKTVNVF